MSQARPWAIEGAPLTARRRPLGLIVFALTSILSLTASAFADDSGALTQQECTPTPPMDEKGGSMEHVKVRDQYKLSICWSEAESEMADAIRFSVFHQKNYKFQTSAVATACGVSTEKGINALSKGGKSCWAFDYMKKHGICSEQVVEDGALAETQSAISDFSDAGNRSQALQAGEDEGLNSRFRCPETLPRTENSASSPHQTGHETGRGIADPALLDGLIQNSYSSSQGFRAVTRACERRPPSTTFDSPFSRYNVSCEPFPAQTSLAPSPSVYARKLNELLNQPHPLPIEIDYCSSFFDAKLKNRGQSSPCNGHASLVIGKRWHGGRCQFMIRNSWGTDCGHYTKRSELECIEGTGDIWVDSDLLTKNTLGLVPPPVLTPVNPSIKPKP